MKFSMKKVALLVFVIAMCSVLSVCAFADDPILTVGSATVEEGSTDIIEIPISISNNPGINGLDISVEYPTGIELTELAIEGGVGLSGTLFTPGNDITANPYSMNWGSAAVKTSEGLIATLRFKLNGATIGEHDIKVRVNKCTTTGNAVLTVVNREGVAFNSSEFKTAATITVIEPQIKVPTIEANTTIAVGHTGTFDVPINIHKNPGILILDMTVVAPEGFTLEGASDGDIILVDDNYGEGLLDETTYHILLEEPENADADGSILVLTFNVENAEIGSYDIGVEIGEENLDINDELVDYCNLAGQSLAEGVLGTITVEVPELSLGGLLTLGNNVGVRFGVITSDNPTVDYSKVSISIDGASGVAVESSEYGYVVPTADIQYAPAKDFLQKSWTVSMTYADEIIDLDPDTANNSLTVTYENYVNGITEDKLKKLVDAMVVYCKYAATYFGTKTYQLNPLDAITDTGIGTSSTYLKNDEKIAGLDYYLTSLILDETIAVRHYYTITDSALDTSKITFDSTNKGTCTSGIQTVDETKYYYVQMDIPIASFASFTSYRIKFTDGTSTNEIRVSPLHYINSVLSSTSTENDKNTVKLKDLCTALYHYHALAKAY